MSEQDILKPCPFCGGNASRMLNGSEDDYFWWVECCECNATIDSFATSTEAIEAWNTRAERTCKPTEEDYCPICGEDLVKCNVGIGELGGAVELDPPIYHNYCPNCGAKGGERMSNHTLWIVDKAIPNVVAFVDSSSDTVHARFEERRTCKMEGFADVRFSVDYEVEGYAVGSGSDYATLEECGSCGAYVIEPPAYHHVLTCDGDEIYQPYNYCPNCGARVEKEGHDG